MKIFLKEEKLAKLLIEGMISEYEISDGNSNHNPYAKHFEAEKQALEQLLANYGKLMVNKTNGKEYVVYEIYALADILGHRYAICRLIRDNEPYGQTQVKPLDLFKIKNY